MEICHVRVLSKDKITSEKPLRMGFATGFCSAASVNSVPRFGKLGYPTGMAECAHGLVYRKIAVIESISVRKGVY